MLHNVARICLHLSRLTPRQYTASVEWGGAKERGCAHTWKILYFDPNMTEIALSSLQSWCCSRGRCRIGAEVRILLLHPQDWCDDLAKILPTQLVRGSQRSKIFGGGGGQLPPLLPFCVRPWTPLHALSINIILKWIRD